MASAVLIAVLTRSDNQQKDDQHAERKRQHVVEALGASGDVQEEDEVNAHLRDRQHHQCNRNAGLPDQRRTGDEERDDCDQRRQPKADQITANAFGYLAAIDRLVAGSQVAFMQMQTDIGVAHRATPIR